MPPLCVLCEEPMTDDNWKHVEVKQQEQVIYWVMCIWCAQSVKETFEQKEN